MATTARLGIDILARDRTAAAFASAQRAMGGLHRMATQLKFAFAGIVGGAVLSRFVRELIEVNAKTAPVKAALDGMSQAWTNFALRVGEAGVNDALVSFAQRLTGAMSSATGLDQVIGQLLGGAINGIGAIIIGIGEASRGAMTLVDGLSNVLLNLGVSAETAKSPLSSFFGAVGAELNQFVADASNAIDQLGKIAFALKNLDFSNAGLKNGTGLQQLFDIISTPVPPKSYLEVSLKGLAGGIAAVNQAAAAGKGSLPANINALGELSKKAHAVSPVMTQAMQDAKSFEDVHWQAMRDLGTQAAVTENIFAGFGDTITSKFSDALFEGIDGSKKFGAAFKDMTFSILRDLTKLQLDAALKGLFNSGGILNSLFGGLFGGGGIPISPSQGPLSQAASSLGRSSASGKSAINVQIIDQRRGGAPVEVQRSGNGLKIMLRDAIRSELPGALSTIMPRQFGLSPANRTR